MYSNYGTYAGMKRLKFDVFSPSWLASTVLSIRAAPTTLTRPYDLLVVLAKVTR